MGTLKVLMKKLIINFIFNNNMKLLVFTIFCYEAPSHELWVFSVFHVWFWIGPWGVFCMFSTYHFIIGFLVVSNFFGYKLLFCCTFGKFPFVCFVCPRPFFPSLSFLCVLVIFIFIIFSLLCVGVIFIFLLISFLCVSSSFFIILYQFLNFAVFIASFF